MTDSELLFVLGIINFTVGRSPLKNCVLKITKMVRVVRRQDSTGVLCFTRAGVRAYVWLFFFSNKQLKIPFIALILSFYTKDKFGYTLKE